MDAQYSVRRMRQEDGPEVLRVINNAFQRERTAAWFDWKHTRGPWGPSTGWVAEDPEGQVVAARLFLPWQLVRGTEILQIHRAMDGAVIPVARRQGLFSRTVRAEMAQMKTLASSPAATYSTSVAASRDAYAKLGWSITRIEHLATPTVPRFFLPSHLVWDDAIDHYRHPHTCKESAKFATAWTANALKWRTAPESGLNYRSVRLRKADEVHGAVVRVAALRRVRTLVVTHAWGDEATLNELRNSAATRLACPIILEAGRQRPRWSRPSGESTISMWAPSPELLDSLPNQITFDLADLEGVM